ncbi:acetyl-CoA C-acetyltransferase [Campylobacter upsaliensis]|nr:acetyl-CoA C-acetyltransferase [Campylobacter upsaliensis]
MQEVVVVAAKRTAIGSFLGSLKQTKAVELVSMLTKSLLDETGVDKSLIDELILGQVLGAGCGQNVARQALINSGLSVEKTAFVVNMLCGSGLKAIELGYDAISLNRADLLLCGGVENMSLAPFLLKNARLGYKMGDQNLVDSMIKDGIWCALSDCHMGITAENLAKKYGLSREEQDEFALNSQLKAAKAIENKAFETEILPLKIQDKKREFLFSEDEFVRKDANLEALSRLKPAFDKNGSVTAGNSSGVNDGAAMLLLSSKEKALELNLPILATLKGFASVGVEPNIMGIGAAFAAKKALEKTHFSIDDMDLIEANEAFAAQSLATLKELKANANRVNINGGAIALGHPIGASGARILTSLIYALRARGKNLGLATLCVGGGQGIAAVLEIER